MVCVCLGCAEQGGGAHEMIDDSDVRAGKVMEKVLRQLSRIVSPSLCGVQLCWDIGTLIIYSYAYICMMYV